MLDAPTRYYNALETSCFLETRLRIWPEPTHKISLFIGYIQFRLRANSRSAPHFYASYKNKQDFNLHHIEFPLPNHSSSLSEDLIKKRQHFRFSANICKGVLIFHQFNCSKNWDLLALCREELEYLDYSPYIIHMALAQPQLSVREVQSLIHCLDSAKSKIERLTVRMLNGVRAFSKLNPALASIAIYALCTVAGFIMWIAMSFLDLAAGTRVLDAAIHVTEGLNERVLPALQLLNGLLALLVGFSMLMRRLSINLHININGNSSRINPYNMNTSSRRSKMITALPKGKYGSLRRSDDINMNDPSSCAICLSCIGEEDGVRILPNCKHYFHISCIDRWLLLCPTNSSCPLCRATVIAMDS